MTNDKMEESREFGIQPIDAIMQENSLDNHAVVAASTEQVTHKMVAKARSGRFLSIGVRQKILRALNKALNAEYTLKQLFTY